ncbi:MAG: patatin-like phospholipase family protein [Clostridia bacterium]|nr:patatin-like phospholipase family protein [Clostridia bacterium]
MKIGVALAGGGLKGVAYVGALKAFEELGIKLDYISGTSSGSMIATLYSIGCSSEEIKNIIIESYKGLIKIPKKPIIASVGTYLTKKQLKLQGLISGERVENLVQNVAEEKNYKNINDIKIPLAIATVDTISTKECIFMSKNYNLQNDNIDYIYDISIGKAVRSSMAFPGIFTTSKFGKYNFIDGGTKDNLPVKVLKDMGADITIGLSFKLDDYDAENQNVLSILLRTVDIFSLKDVLAAQKEADMAIEIDAKGTSLMEIDNIDKCIQIGYDSIMENKEAILKLIN